MSLSTIQVAGNDYIAYASVAEADIALAVDPVRMAAWAALTDENKGIDLIAATRRIDLLRWLGAKAGGSSQVNAFPRSGLFFPDGTPVPKDTIPLDLERATILLAGSIAATPAQANAGTSAQAISRVKAGSAEVEFFRRQETITGKPVQDETVFELIRRWLQGRAGSSSTGAMASGTDGVSHFAQTNPYGRTEGFS